MAVPFRFDVVSAPNAPISRAHSRAILLAPLLACASTAATVHAQDRGVSDWSSAADDQCVPVCRDGYECKRGECAPICNPACEPGLLCTGGGECVEVESQAPSPRVSRASTGDRCFPGCRVGFTCLDGACVSVCNPACPRGETCNEHGECLLDREPSRSPYASYPEEGAREAPERLDPTRDSIVDLHVDALGAFQFGLAPTLEIGRKYAGYARLRAVNSGVASYFLLGRDREDELRWGLGGALGLHVFSVDNGNLRGFFGGPALEYVFLETRDVKRDFATYRTHILMPQVDFGYRWGFGSFLLGVGLRLGLAIPVRDLADPVGLNGCRRRDSCDAELDVRFVPGLTVDVGYFFPRR